MPSRRTGKFLVISSSSKPSQSTLALASKMGKTTEEFTFHFWILYVMSREACPSARSVEVKTAGSLCTRVVANHRRLRLSIASTTEGAQLAGNQMYKVFILLIDPNHSLKLARALPCFSNLPFRLPFPPAPLSQGLQSTLTSPLAALLNSLARLGRQRNAVLRSSL